MAAKFSALVAHVTGGRRYCFVVMSYHEGYAFFDRIRKVVAEVTGFECIRADDLPAAGEDLRQKVHDAIENAVFVIGDISDPRPNIYYEVGYAAARNKPILLLGREGAEIHSDLAGLEMIRYVDNREGWPRFEMLLRQHLDVHKDSNISLLRAMLLPHEPVPSFILINPKKPSPDSRFPQHPRERRTYGDYLGLSGVMGAFLSVYGEHAVPEIVSASHADDSLADWDANLYLIGSPKVNTFTGLFLELMQRGQNPGWYFERCAGEENLLDYEMQLVGDLPSGRFQTPCGSHDKEGERADGKDYGIILRGPHPRHPNRMVLIMAGPHSMGTGAACLAATKPQLLQDVNQRLSGKADLTDRQQAFWILVKGQKDYSDHLDVSGVQVVDVGTLQFGR